VSTIHVGTGVIDCVRPCEWQDFITPKVCVQNVHRVLEVERKLEDVDATA